MLLTMFMSGSLENISTVNCSPFSGTYVQGTVVEFRVHTHTHTYTQKLYYTLLH